MNEIEGLTTGEIVIKYNSNNMNTSLQESFNPQRSSNVDPLSRREFLKTAGSTFGSAAVVVAGVPELSVTGAGLQPELIPYEGLPIVDSASVADRVLTVVGVSVDPEDGHIVPVLTEGSSHHKIVQQRTEELPKFVVRGLKPSDVFDAKWGRKQSVAKALEYGISPGEIAQLFGVRDYSEVHVPNLDISSMPMWDDFSNKPLNPTEVNPVIIGKSGFIIPHESYPNLYIFPRNYRLPNNPETGMWEIINESPLREVVETFQKCVQDLKEKYPRSGGVNLMKTLFEFEEENYLFSGFSYLGYALENYLPDKEVDPLQVLKNGRWVESWSALRQLALIFPELRQAFRENGLEVMGQFRPVSWTSKNNLGAYVFLGTPRSDDEFNEYFGYSRKFPVATEMLVEGENRFHLGSSGQVEAPFTFNLRRAIDEAYDGWLLEIWLGGGDKPRDMGAIAIPTGAKEVMLNVRIASGDTSIGQGLVRAKVPSIK